MKKEDMRNKFIKYCEIIKGAREKGDYSRNNRAMKKAVKIFKYLENNLDIAEKFLYDLLFYDHVVVKIKAAAWCLSLNIFVGLAKDELKKIVENEDNMFGFDAKMLLEVVNDQGYKIIYQGQTPRMITE